MEHPEELNLDQVVRQQGPLRVHQAVDYLIQAACVIEAAHASGVIHRDIRPRTLVVDSNGIVRVLGLGQTPVADANDSSNKAGASGQIQTCTEITEINYKAPEQTEISQQVDHRADIYSLGCSLFYLLTGREPFPEETVQERLMGHAGQALRVVRPDVPLALEAAYEQLVAPRPQDLPSSMTEVIALLKASTAKRTAADQTEDAAWKLKAGPHVVGETVHQQPGTAGPIRDPSRFVRRQEREGLLINHELNIEDLVLDRRPGDRPALMKPPSAPGQHLKRLTRTRARWRRPHNVAAIVAVGAIALFAAALVRIALSRRPATVTDSPRSEPIVSSNDGRDTQTVESSDPAPAAEARTIFDGASGQGWDSLSRRVTPAETGHIHRFPQLAPEQRGRAARCRGGHSSFRGFPAIRRSAPASYRHGERESTAALGPRRRRESADREGRACRRRGRGRRVGTRSLSILVLQRNGETEESVSSVSKCLPRPMVRVSPSLTSKFRRSLSDGLARRILPLAEPVSVWSTSRCHYLAATIRD
jgi:serine/threonine protein kinase